MRRWDHATRGPGAASAGLVVRSVATGLLLAALGIVSPSAASAQDAPETFELPMAWNLWAPLENQVPGAVSNRVDVGGLRSAAPAHVGGFGTTWTQNGYTIGSIDATDPYSGGVPLIDPDIGAYGEIRYLTGEHPSGTQSPGIVISLIPRRGGREFHGGADLAYTDRNLQSRALADQEREARISSPEHFGRFLQGGVRLGGPLDRSGSSFFASLATDRLSRYAENTSVPEAWNRTSASLSITLAGRSSSTRVLGVLEGQHDTARDASPLQPPASSLDERRTDGLLSVSQSRVVGSATEVEGRAGYSAASIADRFPSGASSQSALTLFTGNLSGAAPMATDSRRERGELELVARRAVVLGESLTADASAGGVWKESSVENRDRVLDGVNLEFFQGSPSAVVLFDPDMRSRQRIREIGLFLQFDTRVGNLLTVAAGLRFDAARGWLPGAPVGAIDWSSLSPRIAVAAPVGRHVALRASYARYAHALLGRELEAADPRGVSGRVAVWNDANGDGQYQQGEEGQILRVFGGRYTTLDPGLRPPVTDAFELEGEWHPRPRFAIEITARQRYEKNLVATVDTGVPASSYSPVPWTDPKTGNTITVYEQEASTLGQDHYLLTNPSGFRAFHRGGQILARWTSASDRLYLEGSFDAFSIVGEASSGLTTQEYDEGVIGSLFDNPNTLLHADGRLFFDRGYLGKGWAFYRLPGDASVGCVIKYYDGTPYARRIVVAGLNQGPFTVFATQRGNLTIVGQDPRNGPRTEAALTVDLGVEKAFAMPLGRLAARLDGFNLLNIHSKTRNNDVTGPTYEQAVETVAPVVARFSLQWTF